MSMHAPTTFRYPCTGHVGGPAFGDFLKEHLGAPRANLHELTSELSALLRCPNLTLVNSGSSANLVAALAIGERCGMTFGGARERPKRRRVLASGFTFPTTISALRLAGFEVTLVDTEPMGFNASPDAVKRAIDDDVAALCITHFLGFPARIDVIADLAAAKGINWILQDACETLNLRVAGYPIHAWSTFTTYGFYHPHHLSTYGGGGVVTHDRELSRVVESLTHWGRACTHHYDEEMCEAPPEPDHQFWYVRDGINVEMSELNACFGLYALESHPSDEKRRATHYGILYEALASHPKLLVTADPFSGSTPFVFPIRVRAGDARPLTERLLARGVETRTLMGGAMSEQPAFKGIAHDGLAACKATAAATVFVGVHQTLKTEDVEAMAKIVADEATKA